MTKKHSGAEGRNRTARALLGRGTVPLKYVSSSVETAPRLRPAYYFPDTCFLLTSNTNTPSFVCRTSAVFPRRTISRTAFSIFSRSFSKRRPPYFSGPPVFSFAHSRFATSGLFVAT